MITCYNDMEDSDKEKNIKVYTETLTIAHHRSSWKITSHYIYKIRHSKIK